MASWIVPEPVVRTAEQNVEHSQLLGEAVTLCARLNLASLRLIVSCLRGENTADAGPALRYIPAPPRPRRGRKGGVA